MTPGHGSVEAVVSVPVRARLFHRHAGVPVSARQTDHHSERRPVDVRQDQRLARYSFGPTVRDQVRFGFHRRRRRY